MNAEADLEAAEYVLGTLTADERARYATRLASDTTALQAVAAWERRFAALNDSVADIAPGAHVWSAIERALRPSGGATLRDFKVITGGGGRIDSNAIKVSRDRWRGLALASGAIAAALLVLVVAREVKMSAPAALSDIYVAAVNRGGDKPALIVRVDLKTRQVFVRPVATETPAGKSLELWYIGDGKPPRSMGIVDKVAEKLTIPRGAQDEAATFAVTLEPQGGSASGNPTGPIVYAGQLVKE